jgi:hypothetical protein
MKTAISIYVLDNAQRRKKVQDIKEQEYILKE